MTAGNVPIWKKDFPLPKFITDHVPEKYIPQIPAALPIGAEPTAGAYQANPGELINGLTGLQRSKYLTEGQRFTNPNDFKTYMQEIMNSGDVEKSMQGISPDGKRFIRSLVPLSPIERQKVIDRAAFIMPGIVQNTNTGYNQKIGEYNNMNEHFYDGFIKRAQQYGLTVVEAERLIKAAGPVNEGDAAYAGYPKDRKTKRPIASKNTIDAFKKPTPPPVNPGAAAYAGYPTDPVTGDPQASQNTIDAFKKK